MCLRLPRCRRPGVAAGNAVAPPVACGDCNDHGYKLTHSYTIAELEHALATMPASIKEYTPCYQVISQELQKLIGTTTDTTPSGTSGSSSSFLSGPLIVIVIVLVLAGGGAAYLASRRKPGDEQDGPGDAEGVPSDGQNGPGDAEDVPSDEQDEPGGGDDQPPPATGP